MQLYIKPIVQPNRDINIYMSGAKNALLPLIFSTPMLEGCTYLDNAPVGIKDYTGSKIILSKLGLDISESNNLVHISNKGLLNEVNLPPLLTKNTRCSLYLLGSLAKAKGKVNIGFPGGCAFGGDRRFDLHLDGLRALNAKINIKQDMISLEYSKDIDSYYSLPFPSVGATTNLILYSCIGTSEVIIENCAIEPEILNLVEFLNKCGAKVHFDILKRSVFIKGVSSLNGTKIEVISDRIQIMTYVALAMMHRRRLHLYGVHSLNDIAVPLAHLGKSGLEYSYNETRGTLSIFADKIIKFSGFNIKCGPYPEFPTDLQPIFLALSLMAESTSLIEDTVIPNRNVYITELTKLGYDVSATKHMLKCNPSDLQYISNQQLVCPDLRGGMACIMAASVLKGKTTILNGEQVLRGYDNLRKNLSHFMDISFAVSENTSTYNNAVAV